MLQLLNCQEPHIEFMTISNHSDRFRTMHLYFVICIACKIGTSGQVMTTTFKSTIMTIAHWRGVIPQFCVQEVVLNEYV